MRIIRPNSIEWSLKVKTRHRHKTAIPFWRTSTTNEGGSRFVKAFISAESCTRQCHFLISLRPSPYSRPFTCPFCFHLFIKPIFGSHDICLINLVYKQEMLNSSADVDKHPSTSKNIPLSPAQAMDFRVLRRLSEDSILVSWTIPGNVSIPTGLVDGYEVRTQLALIVIQMKAKWND